MKLTFNSLILLVLPCGLLLGDPWVFEGVIEKLPENFKNTFRVGWVFSGSFDYNPAETTWVVSDLNRGRWNDGISGAELTIDSHYIIQFSADQAEGADGLEVTQKDATQVKQDFIGINIPMDSISVELLDGNVSKLLWNQIWLYDADGKMVKMGINPLTQSPFNWKKGWFRMCFSSANNEYQFIEGYLTRFAPFDEDDVNLVDEYKAIILELGLKLSQRESRLAELEYNLNEAQTRIQKMNEMIDFLISERDQFKKSNEILALQELPNKELVDQLDQLTATKVILEKKLEEALDESKQLNESVVDLSYAKHKVDKEIEELRSKVAGLSEELSQFQSESTESGVQNIEVVEESIEESDQDVFILVDSIHFKNEGESKKESFMNRKRGPRSKN